MNYVPIIEQALSSFDGAPSLTSLLERVDALNKSVPTLEELNDAFAQLQANDRWPEHDLNAVSKAAYEEAVSQYRERMRDFLEASGFSRKLQQQLLQDNARMWGRDET